MSKVGIVPYRVGTLRKTAAQQVLNTRRAVCLAFMPDSLNLDLEETLSDQETRLTAAEENIQGKNINEVFLLLIQRFGNNSLHPIVNSKLHSTTVHT